MIHTDSIARTAVLLVDCPDRKGILAAIADFLHHHVLHADQHQDNKLGLFFMRIEWDLKDFDMDRVSFREGFEPIARNFQIRRSWYTPRNSRRWPSLCPVTSIA